MPISSNNLYYANGRVAYPAQLQQLTITQGPARVPVNFGAEHEVTAESEWQHMMGFTSGGTDLQTLEPQDLTAYDQSEDVGYSDYFYEDITEPSEVANFYVSNPLRSSASQP